MELVSRLDPIHESDTQSHGGSLFGGSLCLSMSADGRYTVFSSDANNLIAGQVDTNRGQDVFLYDRVSGLTSLVSHVKDAGTRAGNDTSGLCTISADGSVVAFTSDSLELDGNSGKTGAFLYDRATGALTLAAPFQYHGNIQALSLSADGRFLAFSSSISYPGTTDPGGFDVFVYDRNTGTTTLVSHADGASTTAANQNSFYSQISADGRFVVFSSRASNLVSGMSEGTQNVFLYELATGAVMLVSHASSSPGVGGDADSETAAISADGSYVLFSSAAGNLVSGMTDANGPATSDLFLYERASGTIALVSHVAGSATTTADSGHGVYPPGLSADGRYVVFSSPATDLAAGQVDDNGTFDVFLYDRVTGTSSLVSRPAGSSTTAQGGTHTGISADGGTVSRLALNGGLFLYDRVTGARVLVNHASGSPQTPANGGAGGDAFHRTPVSADGRFVSYLSPATDLVAGVRDFNGAVDVLVFDRDTAVNAIASASPPSMKPRTPLGTSEAKAISADGRFTVFVSTSRQLLTGPQSGNSGKNVFLRDRLAGTTTLVSRSSAGAHTGGNGESDLPAISADGRFIAFASRATDLVPGTIDNNFAEDVFVYDRLTGATSLVSRTAANPARTGNGGSTSPLSPFPILSADGRFVLYMSPATNLVSGQTDDHGSSDLFLFDRQTGSTTLVSHGASSPAAGGNSVSSGPALSADGRFVAFTSYSNNLVPGQSGFYSNLFFFDRLSGTVTLVSQNTGSPSAGGNGETYYPRISADGRYVTFFSEANNLTPEQKPGVFLWNRVTQTTVQVNRSLSPAPMNGWSWSPRISADGRFVPFLSSEDDLVPGQTPTDVQQVFLYDHLLGTIALVGQAPPAIGGFGSPLVGEMEISADGRFIVFIHGTNDAERAGLFLYDRLTGTTTLASHALGLPDTVSNGDSLGTWISSRGDIVAFTSSSTDLVAGDFNDATDAFLYVNPLPSGRDFFTLTPCRILDTRQPQDGPALASGQAEILSLHGVCGIPATATARAVAVNVTVTQPTGAGYLSFAPGDLGDLPTSTINFGPGQTRANNAILPLALNGLATLRVSPAVTGGGTVHVLLDVVGYFE